MRVQGDVAPHPSLTSLPAHSDERDLYGSTNSKVNGWIVDSGHRRAFGARQSCDPAWLSPSCFWSSIGVIRRSQLILLA